jgi:hypothetical protein
MPYKCAAPAVTDMIAGQVSIILTTPFTAQEMIRAGKIKDLAVAGYGPLGYGARHWQGRPISGNGVQTSWASH